MATRIVRGQKVNQRKMRHPTTNFNLKTRPWQLQPFCIFRFFRAKPCRTRCGNRGWFLIR